MDRNLEKLHPQVLSCTLPFVIYIPQVAFSYVLHCMHNVEDNAHLRLWGADRYTYLSLDKTFTHTFALSSRI